MRQQQCITENIAEYVLLFLLVCLYITVDSVVYQGLVLNDMMASSCAGF